MQCRHRAYNIHHFVLEKIKTCLSSVYCILQVVSLCFFLCKAFSLLQTKGSFLIGCGNCLKQDGQTNMAMYSIFLIFLRYELREFRLENCVFCLPLTQFFRCLKNEAFIVCSHARRGFSPQVLCGTLA